MRGAIDRKVKHARELPIPEDFRARWKERFERRATQNDDDAGIAGWTRSGLQARFRGFRRYWRTPTGQELWFDVGCAAGTYTRFLHAEGMRVIGVDFSVPSLQKARLRSPSVVQWIAADATRLPVASGTIDGALCLGLLQSMPAPEPVLSEIARSLKPEGTLWVDFLNARFLPTRWMIRRRRKAGQPAHLRYETARSIIAALRDCGYEVEAIYWIPILPYALRGLQPVVECEGARELLRRAPRLSEVVSHSVLVRARRLKSSHGGA